MPQLGQYKPLLDAVFFLYHSREDAERGQDSGGTGFLVSLPSNVPNRTFVYAVSNWHNTCHAGASVIRINCKEGPPDIFEFEPHEWLFLPGRQDIAVISVGLDATKHKAAIISHNSFLTEEFQVKEDIDAGDDVFMIGRFIDYDGAETNRPSLRFGNISIMSAPIKQPTGHTGSSIVVDMHSRTGYSGSPVFVYRTAGSFFLKGGDIRTEAEFATGHTLRLLGIHWGQFPEKWALKEAKEAPETASLITEGRYVSGLSGMTCVLPASAILEVLNMPKLVAGRTAANAELERLHSSDPIAESAPPTTEVDEQHKERFTALLSAAARKKKPADQT